ncbi:MAG: hypothetical protein R3B96_07620 [Pirellulaceae bacterium]
MLYGAIDSKEVTQRATDPSGAMGAIKRTLANDVACRHVALDFSRPAEERLLFAEVEPDVLPGDSAEADQRIRRTIAHLHERILGRADSPDSRKVARLPAVEHHSRDSLRNQGEAEIYHCRQGLLKVPDPSLHGRAWRSVVTYLLRQPGFCTSRTPLRCSSVLRVLDKQAVISDHHETIPGPRPCAAISSSVVPLLA